MPMTARQTWPMLGPDKMNGPVTVTVKDGTRALLRPVIREDKRRIARGLVQMSSESRYFRFFTSAAKLTEEQLRYFTEMAFTVIDDRQPNGLGTYLDLRGYSPEGNLC
jgi:hypothetical protein